MKRLILLVASLFGVAAMASAQIPAFPGAVGSGATAQAGMGGPVYNITSLADTSNSSCKPFNDDQTVCTFRDCYVNKSGPRYCIPRVSGVIDTGSSDLRTFNGGVYFAGEAGPGGGIKIAGTGAIIWSSASDVVVRYISYDGNSSQNGPSDGSVSFDIGGGNVQRVIYDHFTFFHITNKGALALCNDAGLVGNATFQFGLIFTPDRNHPVGPMADATTCPGGAIKVENIDYVGNLIAVTDHRMPLFNVHSGRWVNNTVWNWGWFAGLWQGGTHPDVIGNNYKHGNLNSGDNGGHPHQFEFTSTQSADDQSHSMPGPPSIYLAGNVGVQQANPNGDQTLLAGMVASEGASETGPVPASWFRTTQLPTPPIPIPTIAATDYDSKYLQTVGNSQGLDCDGNWFERRMTEDQQIIAAYKVNASQQLWVAPPGYKTSPVPPGPAPCVESMHDGIPDAWKQAHHLSLTDPNVYKAIDLPTGLRNLDLYLAGNNGTPPPTPPVVSCTPSSVAPGGSSACVGNQPITMWKASAGTISPTGNLDAPMTPTTVTVTGTNPNGSGQAPVAVAVPGVWTGWLGSDVLPGARIGAQVVVAAGAGPVRSAGCGTAASISPQPSPVVGVTVTVIGGPASCNGGINYWQVQSGSAPPPTPPTVSCSPSSVATGGTSTCTSNQSVTWSTSAGTITAAGLFTAPATAQTVTVKGTNANGQGAAPITVTAAPPPTNFPIITLSIAIPGGGTTTLTCVSTNGAPYVCH